jgi:hypothetical protein
MEIHQHPEMIEKGKQGFHGAMTKYRSNYWFHCSNCKEQSFETKLAGAGAKCTKCSKSRLSNTNGISVFSAPNNGDSIPIPLPNTLPALTHIEEMLIAWTHVSSLACCRLPGGLIGYLQATLFFFWVHSFIVYMHAWNFVEYMGQNVALKHAYVSIFSK